MLGELMRAIARAAAAAGMAAAAPTGSTAVATAQSVAPTTYRPVLCTYQVVHYAYVYSYYDPNPIYRVGSKHPGNIVTSPNDCGAAFPANGRSWIRVRRANGSSGYMGSNTLAEPCIPRRPCPR